MAEPTRAELATVEAQFNAAPSMQKLLADLHSGKGVGGVMGYMRAIAQSGVTNVPHDYQPAVENGRVVLKKKSFIQRNGWFLPAVAVGAPIAAGAALGAFGGAAAAGGASGAGVGAGETGAVTGLGGSGFGTGAGLGITPVAGAAGGVGAAGAGGAALAGGSGVSKAIELLAKAGGPAALMALTRGGGTDPFLSSGGAPTGGFGSGGMLDTQLGDLMDISKRRLLRTEPVHEAAMQLAMKMAPGTAGYGRVNEARQAAQTPMPGPQASPQVQEAIQRLMAGRGR